MNSNAIIAGPAITIRVKLVNCNINYLSIFLKLFLLNFILKLKFFYFINFYIS